MPEGKDGFNKNTTCDKDRLALADKAGRYGDSASTNEKIWVYRTYDLLGCRCAFTRPEIHSLLLPAVHSGQAAYRPLGGSRSLSSATCIMNSSLIRAVIRARHLAVWSNICEV